MTSSCGEPRSGLLAWRLARLGAGSVLLLMLSCGHERMLPARNAKLVPGAPEFAVVEHDGVRVAASGNHWAGQPVDLPDRLTPVKVRIINHSGKALQILYERFTLLGRLGHRYRPLPTVRPSHDRTGDGPAALRPIFATASFFVRPADRDVYPSLPPWPTRLRTDDRFYEKQYALWDDGLPTVEMQRMALPEGVLADGGQMSGYLYFEKATSRESQVRFEADLREGLGAEPVTSIAIPFRIE